MATEIELPDGTILEAPDGVDPSTVAKAYLAKQLKTTAPTEQPMTLPRAVLALTNPGAVELGGIETLLNMGTGLASMIPAGIAGIAGTVLPGPPGQGARWTGNVERALTYQPRSEAGKAAQFAISKPMEAIDTGITAYSAPNPAPAVAPPQGYTPLGEAAAADEERYLSAQNQNPLKSAAMKTGINAALMLLGPRGAAPAEAVAPTAGRSAGAAAAATDLSAVSPELRAAVANAPRKGSISNDALTRHIEAESLPVPIRLTAGEALQDPILLSQERNLRGKHPAMVERMDQTNKALGQNLATLREQIGPEVFSTNAVEHGDSLVNAYKAKDAAAEADIGAKYKALRTAAGGDWPVDAGVLYKSASEQLHKKLLFEHAPKSVMSQLERFATTDRGKMTFEQFEALRTNLARIQRSADGNEAAAAGVIRSAMEDLPVTAYSNSAAVLKTLADEARAAARARFRAIEADPAYKAVVDGATPDNFVRKFVINAPRDHVDLLMRNIGSDPAARQTISVAVLDYLRDAAKLDPNFSGNFSAAGYNKALQALAPKANILFDAQTAETLGKLGNVSRYTTAQPRGSFVNNSNTLVGSLAKPVAATLEGAANYAAMGVPVGTAARTLLEKATAGRAMKRSLKPGAGIVQKRKRGITKRDVME